MATDQTILDVNKLHALIGRLLSHHEELAGRADVSPALTADFHLATQILDAFGPFLETLADRLKPPPGLPESSRASHYS
jgi:hypothetical protein